MPDPKSNPMFRAAQATVDRHQRDERHAQQLLDLEIQLREQAKQEVANAREQVYRDVLGVGASAAPIAAPEVAAASSSSSKGKRGGGLTLFELYDKYVAERKPRLKTIDSWRKRLGDFTSFAGHDRAEQVTADNVRDWKEALIARKLAARTINDGYLATWLLGYLATWLLGYWLLGCSERDLTRPTSSTQRRNMYGVTEAVDNFVGVAFSPGAKSSLSRKDKIVSMPPERARALHGSVAIAVTGTLEAPFVLREFSGSYNPDNLYRNPFEIVTAVIKVKCATIVDKKSRKVIAELL